MLGRGLIRKAAAVAAMTAAVGVAVIALGFAVYAALAAVMVPAAAAAVTALLFAAVAGVVGWLAFRKAAPPDAEEEPSGLGERAVDLFRTRPILGTAAGLAAAWIFLRNPALATMVAAAFTEKARGSGRPRR